MLNSKKKNKNKIELRRGHKRRRQTRVGVEEKMRERVDKRIEKRKKDENIEERAIRRRRGRQTNVFYLYVMKLGIIVF
jgi:hypothetical protein